MDTHRHGSPVLDIDLTSGGIATVEVDEGTRDRFLAGRGLGDWLLWSHVQPGVTDPLGPDNVIVFTSGLLVGTSFPGAVRNCAVFLNVLTGGYGESSSAGHFAYRLKRAGYEALLLRGRAPRPMYLWIDDGRVELRDASTAMGRSTFETAAFIRDEVSSQDLSTCTIGPAGENLVRYASVNCDDRYLGRCGLGAVMGSKNLKAVAVRGTGSADIARGERFAAIESAVREACGRDPQVQARAEHGSLAGGAVGYNQQGMLPVRNFQDVDFEDASRTGWEHIREHCGEAIYCATHCPIVCDRHVEIDRGKPYGGTRVSSMQATPAYNTTKLLIADMPTTIKAFEMCNGYGVDIHAWTCVLGWAIECFERGILSRQDTDGLDLRWGDGPLALESIRRIALREGSFGDLLAEGVALAADKLGQGSGQYAMHMAGMELDDELRVDKAETLGILVETRGAGHVLATPGGVVKRTPENTRKLLGSEAAADPHTYEGKAELIVMAEGRRAIMDCLGLCFFSGLVQDHLEEQLFPGGQGDNRLRAYGEVVGAVTGRDTSEEDLLAVSERMLALEKCMNALAGIRREDEIPPGRFFEPIPSGRSQGMALDRDETHRMLEQHSAGHGWDPRTGVPTRERLTALGLEEVADKLEGALP